MRIPNLIKSSNIKLIVSGNYLEYYEYEKPYYWNFDPLPKGDSELTRENRFDSSIARTRHQLYLLIKANEKTERKNLFITFTFAENIQDIYQANYQWKLFIQRFKTYYKFKLKYIVVMEFQKRGAIHYHAVFFDVPYIENITKIFSNIWTNGFIKVNAIQNVKDLSAYISKYIQKGSFDSRLMGKKAYFSSRNLERPFVLRYPHSVLSYIKDSNIIQILKPSQFSSGRHGIIKLKVMIKK